MPAEPLSLPFPTLPVDAKDDAGDRQAPRLSQLIALHLDFVWRSLRRLGVPQSATDDATQQVWLVLARRLPEIELDRERAYLFGIALRVASEFRRKIARRREVGGVEQLQTADPAPDPHATFVRREARATLDELLDSLPDDLRAVFVLYELEEQTAAQIAELLALPPGTVASRLRRARAVFEDSVKRHRARREFPGIG